MLAAMIEVCAERGAAGVAVAHVVERAGVSRRTFYEIFDDGEDCLMAAVEDSLDRARGRVLAACFEGGSWRDRMRSCLEGALRLFEEEPLLARLLIVETSAAGRRVLARRIQVIGLLAREIERGSTGGRAPTAATQLTAEGMVGAILAVIQGRLIEEDLSGLVDLLNPLMSMIVLPYLGSAAARRELERPPAEPSVLARRSASNPLKELHIRLTYRTVRVLASVAANPGSSNRLIADGAGIADQGQISKLLGRLERLGLIENTTSESVARGEPNAWTLTSHGEDVHHTLSARETA
jgi:AcrR family transcriptional regulator/DNA-binding MarR family transcriptional regulator